jgi:predicted O-methyltransferase YrrM
MKMKLNNLFKPASYRQLRRDWREGRRLRYLQSINFQSGIGDSGWLIYGLVRATKPTICVEIGSARGKSTCFTALGLQHNGAGTLYAIDPHIKTNWNDTDSMETWPIIQRNLRTLGLEQEVNLIRSISEEAVKSWKLPIDLFFIDGDHTYSGVKRDFELFLPYMRPHGLILFHDTDWDLHPIAGRERSDMGVPQFVEELRLQGYPVITSFRDCGLTVLQPVVNGISLQPAPGASLNLT